MQSLFWNGGKHLRTRSPARSLISFIADAIFAHFIGADDKLKEALTFCAAKLEISLDHEVIDYLLKRKKGVQHLFSLLKHLDQASAQQKRKITIPFAKQILVS